MASSYIAVNGHAWPPPKRGVDPIVWTAVDSARDANAVVVGQKIGRDQYKLDNLEWPWLDAETWSSMLQDLKDFYVNVRFVDPVTNSFITIKMYPGDRHGTPYFEDGSHKPTHYKDCKINLVDTGE